MSIQKSLSLDALFAELPFYQRFDAVRAAGFDQVEIGAWTELELSTVSEKLAANRLRLSALVGANRLSFAQQAERDDFLEHLSQSIAVAKSFDCRNLILAQSGGSGLPGCAENDYTCAAAAFRTLLDASDKAARAGVTLHLKSIGDGTPGGVVAATQAAGDVVRMVNSPSLRLLYVAPPAQMTRQNIPDAIHRHRDVIGYVHVCGEVGMEEEGTASHAGGHGRVLSDVMGYDGVVGFACRGENDACIDWIRSF